MLLALDHALHALLLLSAQLVQPLDMLPTQLEHVHRNVVMDLLLVMRPVILETASLLDVSTVKYKVDIPAMDSLQSVNLTPL